MEKLKMSKTNPIYLKSVSHMAGYIFGRIETEEGEKELFCEVMTGDWTRSKEKTVVSSIALEVGMVFESQIGKHEVIEVIKTRKSNFTDKRLAIWNRVKTKNHDTKEH